MAFEFSDAQTADRFLNRLKSGTISGVKAKRYKGSNSILATYATELDSSFETRCQDLENLASSMEGYEISVT